jgi:chemotaxis protein MotB
MSYADLVTLLFACFTTAYAATQVRAQSESPSTVVPPVVVEASRQVQDQPVPTVRDLITPIVLAAVDESHVELIEDRRGLVITLPESATFATGSAVLTAEAKTFLVTLADTLRPTGASLRVEGHTDDLPVTGGRYPSNWELSTARASAVVVFLVDNASLAPARLSAAGYGEFHPRAENDTAEHRALNRRVDVVVIDAGRGDQP